MSTATKSQAAAAPRISIIMPTYNCAQWLPGAIDSMLLQTLGDFEFLIIDDGSEDESAAILADYAACDARIIVHHRPHSGLVAALNFGLDMARGEYIARMDADDIASPQRLEKQVDFLDAHPDHDVCGSDCIQFHDESFHYCSYPSTNNR